jgi:hypothetical protein
VSALEDREWDARIGLIADCHPDSMWTCLGCESDLCSYCDGIPGDETLCWTCINEEDPETT